MKIFIDANIPMYWGGKESSYKLSCAKILELVAKEKVDGVTSSEVFQEIIYRFWYLKQMGKGLAIFDYFSQIMSEVLPVTIDDVREARTLMERYPSIPPRDLLHAAVMMNNQVSFIVSADKDFDKINEIERVDPTNFEKWLKDRKMFPPKS